ncbi:phosphocholine cytidylyltransferase family protein [Desulfovibrio sulfodismutans]|uniref:Phosphocholine cytidylyltransferase family protein n=1 Tax=Desulfolutivibrio sulfodismutans TaxID=63561 RepID=A0A7K3NK46_9BACT|nr:phosphocholine cytidylyltransferase family protein [Desulfolutivibrio sulfodismutans]NDY56125.1 phosphocholine cytidylyltransferase family protein [Desulfolutivibrio sulfodismutans]QLA13178.1 NTP transferase domain-containing protein [Desulfolutivibrio sulfodismutans DSM 3696]
MIGIVAVILAAGRGSRMKALTGDRPKCLTELAGRPLLHWQMDALRAGGAEALLLLRGYRGDMLQPEAQGMVPGAYEMAENPAWAETNMLSTLLCAAPWLETQFASGVGQAVISYSDIVYHADHVAALAACPQDIAITYDTLWEPLWRLRFGDPLLDAETFRQENGLLREIGGKPTSLGEICGQYMGLTKVSAKGWQTLAATCATLGADVAQTDMTAFLRRLLTDGQTVGAVPVAGKWCETDNEADLESYRGMLREPGWSHDWRWGGERGCE